MAQVGTDTFPIFVARHSKFGFAAATCRESKVPNGKALFFFFGIDMLGLQSSGLEVRQLPRQWTDRGGCSRGAETVSNSQDRGRNEGRSENPRRSPSAQLTATGQVNSRRRIGADGKLADPQGGSGENLLHNLGRTCCSRELDKSEGALVRQE